MDQVLENHHSRTAGRVAADATVVITLDYFPYPLCLSLVLVGYLQHHLLTRADKNRDCHGTSIIDRRRRHRRQDDQGDSDEDRFHRCQPLICRIKYVRTKRAQAAMVVKDHFPKTANLESSHSLRASFSAAFVSSGPISFSGRVCMKSNS